MDRLVMPIFRVVFVSMTAAWGAFIIWGVTRLISN
jgi:hypothetical protein